ncbi:ATP-binding cassette domain-containing protein [Vibrio quintilis]|uniref:Nickel import ATP-binding protein NikD n=1 Tax=Vibrio quintilis TaxID=1117707 RepID=A0A1M7YUJ9_9VIBR|nr:ATP-binding cassette domain-containing protein [Vibrio quintilis]SHO56265.1 Nickel import ATP-binding protein NikD [Vibrio quintilis]
MKPQILTFEHLSVRHQDQLLVNELSLTLRQGRTLALIGSSGSGKSLTLAAALELLPAGVQRTNGDIKLNQQTVCGYQLRGTTVASILQNPRSGFNPVRTIGQHARETMLAAGHVMNKNQMKLRIETAFTEVGLENTAQLLRLYPFEMSGGMLQRVMIAFALLSGAPFLFADEPTTDLDMLTQARVLKILERQVQEHQLGLLLVTHDMGVVARLADDVAVIQQGKIIETGRVEKIFWHPEHEATKELIEAHLALYPEISAEAAC